VKFGINTLLWTAGFDTSHLDLLPQIKEMGFDGVEIARFNFSNCPAGPIRRAVEANHLQATFCSALTGRQTLAGESAKETLDFLREGIAYAAEIGANLMCGPFLSAVGYLPGRRRSDEEWKRAVDGIQSLTPDLDAYGITFAIEPLNRFETFFLNTAADARLFCDTVNHPRVGVLFDTFHANIEEKSIASGLDALGARHLKHVHACENDRGAPGSGHVAWNQLFDALQRANYNGWLVIESFGSRIPEIAAAACIWRDLAVSSEALASEGLQFLKQKANRAAPVSSRASLH
jgi:D-psicose/D-tagatose/L-ribulose 3-epimerase